MRPSFKTSVQGIATTGQSGTWYRALQTHFLSTAFPKKLSPGSSISWLNPLTGKTESIP